MAMNPEPTFFDDDETGLSELLTVEEVAALLKVPKSWVYEHTRKRGIERLLLTIGTSQLRSRCQKPGGPADLATTPVPMVSCFIGRNQIQVPNTSWANRPHDRVEG